ncbi:MAG: nitroreductase family deazaflavin-dependent oxidoreductase [Mycobacterium sp.]|jgi:deazaflavin-dependent oxidoreductase (nitroreductase family)|nr:nitroreductase family deazaflavin-dependent oxidoreductase [Mycobacterium sp.]
MTLPAAARAIPSALNGGVDPIARRMPPMAVVHHFGRRSGKAYGNPVMALRNGSGWVVALPYGADVNWVRNVLHAQRADLTWRNVEHRDLVAALIPIETGRDLLPGWFRPFARMLGLRHLLTLQP